MFKLWPAAGFEPATSGFSTTQPNTCNIKDTNDSAGLKTEDYWIEYIPLEKFFRQKITKRQMFVISQVFFYQLYMNLWRNLKS